MTPGQDGLWLHKRFLILAKLYGTDLAFFAGQPLTALGAWFQAHSELMEEGRGAQ